MRGGVRSLSERRDQEHYHAPTRQTPAHGQPGHSRWGLRGFLAGGGCVRGRGMRISLHGVAWLSGFAYSCTVPGMLFFSTYHFDRFIYPCRRRASIAISCCCSKRAVCTHHGYRADLFMRVLLQAKVPYWLRTRAARFVRMQRYHLGERLREQRRAQRELGVAPHISHVRMTGRGRRRAPLYRRSHKITPPPLD